ncbi:hypothetical protein [Rugamonas sp.]|uniref:hypothetical protein n=1 Tax=Rugamonas sp. TaxID=1926287 RepID=UPI0025E17504|nr:hypothetical protein [Rugamonas sp.]
MRRTTLSLSIEQLLASVKKLEGSLRAAGLPPVLARLPLWCLGWYYCAMIDGKTTRILKIGARIGRWQAMVRKMKDDERCCTELIDMDQTMRRDLESTKQTLWELRGICLDVRQLFSNMNYDSARMARKQDAFLAAVGDVLEGASALQGAMASHDAAALSALRRLQAEPQAEF